MTASIYHHMANDVATDPGNARIEVPTNATGFAGWVLARFGPWGAILIIMAAIMWFSLIVYKDSQRRNDQLITIIASQSENTGKQALATADQTRVIGDLKTSTEGLKNSIESMRSDMQAQRVAR